MSIILVPIFLALFASWMLWGWTVGESKNIKWMRMWCAPTFVITAMLLSLGAGAFISKAVVRRQLRAEVTEMLALIQDNIEDGQTNLVLSEIRATDQTGSPDAPDFDILKHLKTMNANLEKSSTQVAEAESPQAERH